MKGIKSFFTPKGNNNDKDIITIDDSDNNSNENSSSSSNTTNTNNKLDNNNTTNHNNNNNSSSSSSSKPLHPLFQKGASSSSSKKDVNVSSRKSSNDNKISKVVIATTTTTTVSNSSSANTTTSSSNSNRPSRSCNQSITVIDDQDDDNDDDAEDDDADNDDNDNDNDEEIKVIEKKKPKRQTNKSKETNDNPQVIIPTKRPKEFFMSTEDRQKQKDQENEQLEKLKGIEMEKKFKKELKENAKKFEVKSNSNVNSFFNSNTYSNKTKYNNSNNNTINLIDDDIDNSNDEYCPYLVWKPVGLPSLSDFLIRNSSSSSNNIIWREKSIDIITIDQSDDNSNNTNDLTTSSNHQVYVDLNVDIKVSPYHTIEFVGQNDYRNLWSHFLSFNERKAQDSCSFVPIAQDNSPAMFEPQNTSQVIGNRREVKEFLKWLEHLAGKRRAGGKKKRKSRTRRSLDDDDLENQISKVMVVMGQSGSGKTSTVYACAREAGYKVIEINASQDRSGTGIRKLFSEAAQSHGVGGDTGSSSELNLILFDDADLVFDEDANMYGAIKDLLKNSKCPVIITTETPLPFFNAIPHEKITLRKLNSPEISLLLKNAINASQVPSTIPEDLLVLLGILSNGDSRACLSCVQLLMSALCHQSINSCTFSCFMDWINKADVDFAQFDNMDKLMSSILKEDEIPELTSSKTISEVAKVITPIITSSEPRKGLIAGGFLITISGKHFLQHQISNHYKTPNGLMSVNVYMGDILCDSVVMSDSQVVMRAPKFSHPGVYPIIIKITDGLVTDTRVRCVTSDLCGIAGGWILLESKRKLITSHFVPIKKTAITSTSSKLGRRKSFSPVDDPIEEFDDDDDFEEVPKKTKSNKRRIVKKGKKTVDSDEDMPDDDVDNDRKSIKRTKRVIDDDNDFDTNVAQDNVQEQPSSIASPMEIDVEAVQSNSISETEEKIYKSLVTVCSRLQRHQLSVAFRFPVSEEEAPGYFGLVAKPMDISTIEQSLTDHLYYNNNESDITAFVDDVRQMWINCKIYNKVTSEIVKAADVLNDFFEKEMLAVFRTLMNEDSTIAVTSQSITIREKKVFASFDEEVDSNPEKLEVLPIIDNKILREALNAAFLSRSQIIPISISSIRDAGLEYENEGLVPVHVVSKDDSCRGCLLALEETWRLRDSWSSAELLSTCASNLATYLVEDDDYLDYHDYRTPQQLSIAGADIMRLGKNILQSSARNALKDAETNVESNSFLRHLIVDVATKGPGNNTILDNDDIVRKTNSTIDVKTVVEIDLEHDDDVNVKKAKSRKSPKIVDSDDEECNFDDEDDDDDDDDDDEDDDADANAIIEEDISIKCWYDLGKELDHTFIRYSVRKQAYINFVTNTLCANETGVCDYSTFKFSKNMKKNSLSSMMALDIIPLVGRMLHSEAMRYEENKVNSQFGDVQRTRRSRHNNKYNYVSNATHLQESTLSSLLEFGFISSPRLIGYGERPKWM